MADIRLGWRKDPWNPKDYMHRTVRRDKLPDVCGSAQFVVARRDQGNEGSCTGHGIGMAIAIVLNQLGLFTGWDSPRWNYNGARLLEGSLNDPQAGAIPSDVYRWLAAKGIVWDKDWPYIALGKDDIENPNDYAAKAVKPPDFAWYRCADGLDGILSALADSHPVSIGNPWPEKWMADPGTGILPDFVIGDAIAGGHETCIFMAVQSEQCFYVANSWGDVWGKAGGLTGCFRMPFQALDTFKALGGYDAQYPVFTSVPAPIPPQKKCLNCARASKLMVNAGMSLPYKLEPGC